MGFLASPATLVGWIGSRRVAGLGSSLAGVWAPWSGVAGVSRRRMGAAGAARGILGGEGALMNGRLDRRSLWGAGRIEPPAAACRWADSLRTEHHARLNEILRAVGCCDGKRKGMPPETNVPPLSVALDPRRSRRKPLHPRRQRKNCGVPLATVLKYSHGERPACCLSQADDAVCKNFEGPDLTPYTKAKGILYHYCSNASFLSIISNREICLNAVFPTMRWRENGFAKFLKYPALRGVSHFPASSGVETV